MTGIGQGRVTDNLQGAPVDRAILVKDADVVAMVLHSSPEYMSLHYQQELCKCVDTCSTSGAGTNK